MWAKKFNKYLKLFFFNTLIFFNQHNLNLNQYKRYSQLMPCEAPKNPGLSWPHQPNTGLTNLFLASATCSNLANLILASPT